MNARRCVGGLVLVAATVACLPIACKRRSSLEKKDMNRLEGTWVWREERSPQPIVIVLQLTSKGRFTRTTYREIGGQRKLLYIQPFNKDLAVEPDSEDGIAKLKKERYQPAVERGTYSLRFGEHVQQIVFEGESLTNPLTSGASGVREEMYSLHTEEKLLIGGRTYQREQ